MVMIHPCVEETQHKNICIQERGRRANFKNPSKDTFQKVRIDGCLIDDNSPRADWIISKKGEVSVIVELKGKDVNHAFKQVFATLESNVCVSWMEPRKAILVVCSRYPAFDSSIGKSQEKARKLGIKLKVVCGKADCDIMALL